MKCAVMRACLETVNEEVHGAILLSWSVPERASIRTRATDNTKVL